MTPFRKGIFFLLITVFIITLDQVSKYFALTSLSPFYPTEGFHLFGIHLNFLLIYNKGAAWGMLAKYPIFLISLRFFLLAFLCYYIFFITHKKWVFFALCGVFAAALSNIIDVCIKGAVVDMIHVSYKGASFPVFNIADMVICLSVITLLVGERILQKKGT